MQRLLLTLIITASSPGHGQPILLPNSANPKPSANPSPGSAPQPAATAANYPAASPPPANMQRQAVSMPPPSAAANALPQPPMPTDSKPGIAAQPVEVPKPAMASVPKTSVREIKDPTDMSPRFRQAMKQMVPSGGKGGNAADRITLPEIRLAGRSLGGKHGGATALIQIKDAPPFLVRPGSQFSVPSPSGDSLTIRVESIDEGSVQLVVLPYNRRLFIN